MQETVTTDRSGPTWGHSSRWTSGAPPLRSRPRTSGDRRHIRAGALGIHVELADRILQANPSVVQVVPLTRTLRAYESEITIEPDDTNGLIDTSAAQCQHIRAVATSRVNATIGNVGTVMLNQVRGTLAVLLDL